MTDKETGGPAFPQGKRIGDFSLIQGGITIRDYFAAKAMQGMIIANWNNGYMKNLVIDAYQMADTMLQERNK